MPAEFIKGDIFQKKNLCALAHGCNCAGAMGKGLAKEIRQRWPRMYEEYRRRCLTGEFNLGNVFVWQENGFTIFNLATQKTWKTKADIAAIEKALVEMVRLSEEMQISSIGIPRIGAGLGRLDWSDVKAVLKRVAKTTNVKLVVFEEFEPEQERESTSCK